MKSYWIIGALSLLITAGCSVTKSTTGYDDVYSGITPSDDEKSVSLNKTNTTDPDYSEQSKSVDYYAEDFETNEGTPSEDEPYITTQETVTSPEGTSYITNNYYGSGYNDYYDYSYASRINRFYSPYMGFNYYSPFYTGMYYDPWYSDYYWYRPSLYFGYNWGWGDMYWGYPYYSYYYPYNSYWYGYYNGYWDGYYFGGGYDYNGYGSSSNYYGHRPSRSGHNTPQYVFSKNELQGNATQMQPNYFERTKPAIADNFSKSGRTSTLGGDNVPDRPSSNSLNDGNSGGADSRNISKTGVNTIQDNSGSSSQNEPVSGQRYTYKKPAGNESANSRYKPGETINTEGNYQKPVQRYSKPSGHSSSDNTSGSRQGSTSGSKNTQTYSRPQSTQNDSYSRPSKVNVDRQNQPSRSSENYSRPSNTDNTRYSQPSRSSNSYNQPSRSNSNSSRSYSTPSNSGSSKSYSSPSRSSNSGSYSSPSRSGSSSSGSSGRGGRK